LCRSVWASYFSVTEQAHKGGLKKGRGYMKERREEGEKGEKVMEGIW
jgi:hypothetical protein